MNSPDCLHKGNQNAQHKQLWKMEERLLGNEKRKWRPTFHALPTLLCGSITSICPRAHKNDCLFSSYEDTDTFLDSCCYTAITNYKSGWAQWVRLGGRASRFIGLYNCLYRKRVEYFPFKCSFTFHMTCF